MWWTDWIKTLGSGFAGSLVGFIGVAITLVWNRRWEVRKMQEQRRWELERDITKRLSEDANNLTDESFAVVNELATYQPIEYYSFSETDKDNYQKIKRKLILLGSAARQRYPYFSYWCFYYHMKSSQDISTQKPYDYINTLGALAEGLLAWLSGGLSEEQLKKDGWKEKHDELAQKIGLHQLNDDIHNQKDSSLTARKRVEESQLKKINIWRFFASFHSVLTLLGMCFGGEVSNAIFLKTSLAPTWSNAPSAYWVISFPIVAGVFILWFIAWHLNEETFYSRVLLSVCSGLTVAGFSIASLAISAAGSQDSSCSVWYFAGAGSTWLISSLLGFAIEFGKKINEDYSLTKSNTTK